MCQIRDLLVIYDHLRRPRAMKIKQRSREMRLAHAYPDGVICSRSATDNSPITSLLRAIQRLGLIRFCRSTCGDTIFLERQRKRGRSISEANGHAPEADGWLPCNKKLTIVSRAISSHQERIAPIVFMLFLICEVES